MVDVDGAEGVDEGGCESGIGEQRHIEVDSASAHMVAHIVRRVGDDILGDTHHQLDGLAMEQVERLGMTFLSGLIDRDIRHSRLVEELAGAAGSIDSEAFANQLFDRV